MRLLNTETLRLQQFYQEPFPPYAILSHRWGDQEISLQELEAGLGKDKDGHQKITTFCARARERGFEWAWVDTCGIDKTSSAELSEAINSMYKWYKQSAVCFVYLPDVTAQVQPDGSTYSPGFNNSCWFTRGWTLQELIAPRSMEFYTSDWTHIGNKNSNVNELSRITGVDVGVLRGADPVWACSIARIMSWASKRVTTRKEDIAYCLLGLFNIHMPLLYGEGDRAFIRLQEEILKRSSDQSLFAWNPLREDNMLCGIFAPSPACFADSRDIVPLREFWNTESALTNRGVRLRMPFKHFTAGVLHGFLCCAWKSESYKPESSHVAIGFISGSGQLEDLDPVTRMSGRLKFGNWKNPGVELKQVYLATETSLSHAFYPLEEDDVFRTKDELYFHVYIRDSHNLANLEQPLETYCTNGLQSVKKFEGRRELKLIMLVPPRGHSEGGRVAVLLPITLSQKVALVFGYKTTQSGVSDIRQIWNTMVRIQKDQSLEEVCSYAEEPGSSTSREASKITIDAVEISVEISQLPWWSGDSRNVFIDFSPVLNESGESRKGEFEGGTKDGEGGKRKRKRKREG
jgi:hypothetical protein